jgi:hypothetical protein
MALNEASQYVLDRTEAAYLSDEEELMIELYCYSLLISSREEAEEQEIYGHCHGAL